MMSKKHYELFADEVAKIEDEKQRYEFEIFFSCVFHSDNDKFSRDLFLKRIKQKRDELKQLRKEKKIDAIKRYYKEHKAKLNIDVSDISSDELDEIYLNLVVGGN